MNIAIVGAGISGISAAYNLQKTSHVTLIEQNEKLGGHSNTISVKDNVKEDKIGKGGLKYLILPKGTLVKNCL